MFRRASILLITLALLTSSCSDGNAETATPTSPPTTVSATTTTAVDQPVLTASARGVTPDVIRIGVLGIDFDTLRELGLVDINRGDFQLVVDAFVDDINNRGGIHGRLVEATVVEVSPVDMTAADEGCIKLTEDVEVFAVLGGFVGPTAISNTCFAVRENTIMIGGAPTLSERADATAPWISTVAGPDRHLPAALKLMDSAGLLNGTIGVAWDITEQPVADDIILATLSDLGVDVGGQYIQGTTEGDAFAGQVEWETLYQRILTDDVDTMLMLEGVGTFGTQELIANGFDGQVLIVDDTGLTGTIGARSRVTLEELSGVIGTAWLDSPEAWQQEATQDCVAIFEAANPDITVLQSNTVPSGEPNWSQSIGPLCTYMRVFEWAATNAGADLNHATFLAGVEAIGSFEIVGQGPGLLGPGKLDAGNAIRLVQFDPTDLPDGGSKPYGPVLTLDEIDSL